MKTCFQFVSLSFNISMFQAFLTPPLNRPWSLHHSRYITHISLRDKWRARDSARCEEMLGFTPFWISKEWFPVCQSLLTALSPVKAIQSWCHAHLKWHSAKIRSSKICIGDWLERSWGSILDFWDDLGSHCSFSSSPWYSPNHNSENGGLKRVEEGNTYLLVKYDSNVCLKSASF